MAVVAALAADRARALALTPVSRETLARLDAFAALLLAWNTHTNLIAASTVPQLWTRHIADSLQLLDLAPNARVWIDLGSGAGFPGLVIASALADTAGAKVHLVESSSKKAAFLREACRVTDAAAEVHALRIDKFVDSYRGQADVITARALAPLRSLLDQSAGLLRRGAVGLFPKGRDVEAELTEATKSWKMAAELVASRTSPDSRIVVVRSLARRPAADT
jgi:16S rRNA (guanine527-N7)-methyltransferase